WARSPDTPENIERSMVGFLSGSGGRRGGSGVDAGDGSVGNFGVADEERRARRAGARLGARDDARLGDGIAVGVRRGPGDLTAEQGRRRGPALFGEQLARVRRHLLELLDHGELR